MEQLVTIAERQIAGAPTPSVDARHLHHYLSVKKDYTNWVKTQIARARLVVDRDYVVFAQKGENPSGGRPATEYFLTLDAGKHVAMMSGTEAGFKIREFFIQAEKELRRVPEVQFKDVAPVNYGAITSIVRRELESLKAAITEQNRYVFAAVTKAKKDGRLNDMAGYVEIGEVYVSAGLAVDDVPRRGVLSNQMTRSLDAYCKQHGVLIRSVRIGYAQVTHWPMYAMLDWLAAHGHEMIRAHLHRYERERRVVHLSVVPNGATA